jgi:predicted RNA methylase
MNDINTLRNHLFDAIEGIKSKTMSIEQAKAIADISQTIINSAKVEVEYAKSTDSDMGSGFLKLADTSGISHPKLGVTVHRLK